MQTSVSNHLAKDLEMLLEQKHPKHGCSSLCVYVCVCEREREREKEREEKEKSWIICLLKVF
jgi:hypothetical protein